MSVHSRLNWNLEVLVFKNRKTRVPREKPLGARERSNQQQTQPTYGLWCQDSSPSDNGGRRVLSPLRHTNSPKRYYTIGDSISWNVWELSSSRQDFVALLPSQDEEDEWASEWVSGWGGISRDKVIPIFKTKSQNAPFSKQRKKVIHNLSELEASLLMWCILPIKSDLIISNFKISC